jgi:hypothetical protein
MLRPIHMLPFPSPAPSHGRFRVGSSSRCPQLRIKKFAAPRHEQPSQLTVHTHHTFITSHPLDTECVWPADTSHPQPHVNDMLAT